MQAHIVASAALASQHFGCKQNGLGSRVHVCPQVLALKAHNPLLQMFVQLLRSENRTFFAAMPDWSADPNSSRNDVIVCVNEMMSALLSMNALAPGASTICTNLYSTHHLPDHVEEPWLAEYCRGSCNEFYPCQLTPYFTGWTFSEGTSHVLNLVLLDVRCAPGTLFCAVNACNCTTCFAREMRATASLVRARTIPSPVTLML